MEDLKLAAIREKLITELKTVKLIVFQNEMEFQSLLEIAQFCFQYKNQSCRILINTAPFREDYDYSKLLDFCNILVMNETETDSLQKLFGVGEVSYEQFAVHVPNLTELILTQGSKSTVVHSASGVLSVEVSKVAKVVDTTGAGDCWIGAFCAVYDGISNLYESVNFANKAAGFSVQKKGTSISFPTLGDIEI